MSDSLAILATMTASHLLALVVNSVYGIALYWYYFTTKSALKEVQASARRAKSAG